MAEAVTGTGTDVVAVDWSGAKTGAAERIWLARVSGGTLVELANGRTRAELIAYLVHLKTKVTGKVSATLTVGLDFSFSLPAWFLRQRGHTGAADLWLDVAEHGETWLADCTPPFWGKKGDRRPDLEAHLRRTESAATVGGISAKSTFQIRGAGTVGTGSLRGMPHLPALRQAGFSVWPFDPPSAWTVVEMYPRLLTGPVHKRSATARADYLEAAPFALSDEHRVLAIASEDAFDAAVSALVMHEHADHLHHLPQSRDPVTLLEGLIWDPNSIAQVSEAPAATDPPPPSLDTAVRRRRRDQAFFIRLGRAIQQHEKVLQRLAR
jgi:hypothetical protein